MIKILTLAAALLAGTTSFQTGRIELEAGVNLQPFTREAGSRVPMTTREFEVADSLIRVDLAQRIKAPVSVGDAQLKQLAPYASYRRQYAAYLNDKGERVIFVNAFKSQPADRAALTKSVYNPRREPNYRFRSRANLSTNKVTLLSVMTPGGR